MSYENEDVLVIPVDLLKAKHIGQGYVSFGDSSEMDDVMDFLLRHASFAPRRLVEEDPTLKQLIPYVVYKYGVEGMEPQIFRYTRTKMQGEARLHGKMSIGVGGHINPSDASTKLLHPGNLGQYWGGVEREMDEEIDASGAGYLNNMIEALLNDDADPVGRVHLGLVHICQVEKPVLVAKEPSMADAGFVKFSDLLMDIKTGGYEGWSKLAIRGLAANYGIV